MQQLPHHLLHVEVTPLSSRYKLKMAYIWCFYDLFSSCSKKKKYITIICWKVFNPNQTWKSFKNRHALQWILWHFRKQLSLLSWILDSTCTLDSLHHHPCTTHKTRSIAGEQNKLNEVKCEHSLTMAALLVSFRKRNSFSFFTRSSSTSHTTSDSLW